MRRSFTRLGRFHFSTSLKCLAIFSFAYLLNFFTGLQYYLWLEKSFESDYPSTMTRIDLSAVNEANAERVLGPPKHRLPNRFLLPNEQLCSANRSQPRVLILVKSAVENRAAREAIRLTWAQEASASKQSIRVAFVLGVSGKNGSVEGEARQYRDLIQIDKLDDYYHNSYKMWMMLRWITEFCSSTSSAHRQYVLFIDDDYYLNLHSLLHYLNGVDQHSELTFEQRRRFLTGYVYNHSRPRRFPHDRWYISLAEYPYDRYPPYVTAGCFLMSRANARLFHLASQYLPLFRFDDIYLGLLAYAMSIPLIPNNELFSSYESPALWTRYLARQRAEEPICRHGYRGQQLLHFWNDRHRSNLSLFH